MNLKEQILNYVPYNTQEEKDKELFLKYINDFEDTLSRNNEYGHFCASAFVVNSDKTKVLMVYHNIYNSWCWSGGHADGEEDLFSVAKREVEEETGIHNLKPLSNDIFAIDTLPVYGHIKKGVYVPAHIHLSVTYLFEANESEPICIKEDENSAVKWIPMEEVIESSTEPHMQKVYAKIMEKMKKIGL